MNDVTPLREFFGTATELRLFGLSIILGAVLGSIFDILRAFRQTIKHHDAVVFIEDALFVFLFGISFYSFCTELCDGILRGFILFGMSLGFFAYILIPGRVVKEIFAVSMSTVVKICKRIVSLLCGLPFFKTRQENS